jgi:tRNA nucleotidyltransferase/poly(A) polymerase
MEHLQTTLATHFRAFERVAVIGGLVRDFAREGRSGFRSDVDLVIDGPDEEVARLAKHLRATPNRFGDAIMFQCRSWKMSYPVLSLTGTQWHMICGEKN